MKKLSLYLNFNGNCEEAFKFYEEVFESPIINMIRYGQMSGENENGNENEVSASVKNKILNAQIQINEFTNLMGSDVVPEFGSKPTFLGNQTYGMIDLNSAEEATKLFNKLSENALEIEMPLEKTFFAELYGSLQDQFGIWWMIHYEGNVSF